MTDDVHPGDLPPGTPIVHRHLGDTEFGEAVGRSPFHPTRVAVILFGEDGSRREADVLAARVEPRLTPLTFAELPDVIARYSTLIREGGTAADVLRDVADPANRGDVWCEVLDIIGKMDRQFATLDGDGPLDVNIESALTMLVDAFCASLLFEVDTLERAART